MSDYDDYFEPYTSQPQKPHKPTKSPPKKPYHNPPKKAAPLHDKPQHPQGPQAPVFDASFAFPNAGHSDEFPGFPSFNIADGESYGKNTVQCGPTGFYYRNWSII